MQLSSMRIIKGIIFLASTPSPDAVLDLKRKVALFVFLTVGVFASDSLFPFVFFGDIGVHFSLIFVLLAALILPGPYFFSIVLISLFSQFLVNEQLVSYVNYLLTVIAFFTLMKTKLNLLSGSLFIAAIVTFPSLALMSYFTLTRNIESSLFVALTMVLGSLVSILVVILLYWLLPSNSSYRAYKHPINNFSHIVFELKSITVVLPLFSVALGFIWFTTAQTEQNLSNELSQTSKLVSQSIERRLNERIKTLTATVEVIQNQKDTSSWQSVLNNVADTNSLIESMVIVDAKANILFAAPLKYSEIISRLPTLNISHREYYKQTRQTLLPAVSKSLKGRGLGELDIVAITAPILNDGKFDGLVQSAVKLDDLIELNLIGSIESSGIRIIITDFVNSTVYRSDGLKLKTQDAFNLVESSNPLVKEINVLEIDGDQYLYHMLNTNNNWQVYALRSPDVLFDGIKKYLIYVLSGILLSLLFIGLFATRLAKTVTQPIANLQSFINGEIKKKRLIEESSFSKETNNLTKNFVEAFTISKNFQSELAKKVDEKTRELKEVNKELFKLSQTDKLSGVYNRGAFDALGSNTVKYCALNKLPYTLVLIDIDHFKRINDNFGHQAGDACIKAISKLLLRMCQRDTDIVARYGGDEFALIFCRGKLHEHITHIDKILKEAENLAVYFNDYEIPFTVSCGAICVKNKFDCSVDDLISMADEQLYISKEKGRNQSNYIEI